MSRVVPTTAATATRTRPRELGNRSQQVRIDDLESNPNAPPRSFAITRRPAAISAAVFRLRLVRIRVLDPQSARDTNTRADVRSSGLR